MGDTHRLERAAVLALLLVGAGFGGSLSAQTGTVTGRVQDAETAGPLAGAQVFVEGTNFGALSNDEGAFIVQNVPPGTHVLRVRLIGYGPVAREFSLSPGETVEISFQLRQSPLQLDGIVVTATGRQRKRELANAVGSIEGASVVGVAPINNVADLLMGRVPGVQVLNSTGTTGMGSRIRIRGASSISLSNSPLVYVDGIRVDTDNSILLGNADQDVSRLDDFSPDEIESIEIVKGPAATTLYGTEAANGVIRITTKRGIPGETRWNVWIETGLIHDPTEYTLNYAGLDASGGPFASSCGLAQIDAGLCSQTAIESYQVLNDPDLSPIGMGNRTQYGLSIQGGSDRISYFVSGELEDETGPYRLPATDREELQARGIPITDEVERPSQLERRSLRVNLDSQLNDHALLAVRAGFVDSHLAYTPNDDAIWGVMANALLGGSTPDDPWLSLAPAQIFGISFYQDVQRITLGTTLTVDPLAWLMLRATGGLDYTNRNNSMAVPRDIGIAGRAAVGTKEADYHNNWKYTLDLLGQASFEPWPTVAARTSIGAQYFRSLFTGTWSWGFDLPNGAASLSTAAETYSNEVWEEDKTLGIFLDQQVALNDRVFINVGLRADDGSAFGQDFDLIWYPKASVSWVASEEPFFPELDFMDQLRLRAAWGRSGLQPRFDDAVRTLIADAVTSPADNTVTGVSIGNVGNPLLEPERSTELELGVDAELWRGRVGLEVTHYRKDTDGALVTVPVAPSAGAGTFRWANIGEVENVGWEAGVSATPIELENVTWNLTVSGSVNRNELVTLGDDVDPLGTIGTRHVPGFPLGGQWDLPLESWSDSNGNGIVTVDEITFGDSISYIGPAMPEHELTIGSSVTLFDDVQLSALLDYRGNYVVLNYSEWFRCRFGICRGLIDASAPFEEQARAAAAAYHPSATLWGFEERTHFWKLRELSIRYSLPEGLAARIRARRAAVTLSGRNLATWTNYTGLDPEINFTGSSDSFGVTEFMTQPPVRYFTLRLDIGF